MLRRNTKLVGEHTLAGSSSSRPIRRGSWTRKKPRPLLDTPDDPAARCIWRSSTMQPVSDGFAGNAGAIGLRWRVGRHSSIVNCNLQPGDNPMLVTGNGGGTLLSIWMANAA